MAGQPHPGAVGSAPRNEERAPHRREALSRPAIPPPHRRGDAHHEHAHRTEFPPPTGGPATRRRMSTHLLIAAAYLEDLPQGTKLVLMAIADSGDEHTLESAPGLPKLRAWSGLGKSQVLKVVGQLVADGHVERLLAGRVGRRAVFRVFPNGVPAIPRPADVAARYADEGGGSRTSDPLDVSTGGDDVVDDDGSRVAPTRPSGSHQTPSRVAPTGPLHASTSVSTRAAPSTGSGFPGARPPAGDRPDPRTRRGAHNMPCPLHADQIVPCGRCAHAAAEDRRRNPDGAKHAAASIRAQLAAAKHIEPDPDVSRETTTEETTTP